MPAHNIVFVLPLGRRGIDLVIKGSSTLHKGHMLGDAYVIFVPSRELCYSEKMAPLRELMDKVQVSKS